MMRIKLTALFVFTLATVACSDESARTFVPEEDTASVKIIDSEEDAVSAKDNLDVDPCEVIEKSDLGWCSCNPECCQSQQWFCQPVFGDPSYYKKEVIVEICDENSVPCQYGIDPSCPPPEIIYEGECLEAYECPPGSQNLDYGWQWCELPDGSVGKQHVTCDKGQLYTSECQSCDPEICDKIDNDCDGLVDEDLAAQECQTQCGPGISVCVMGEELCFGPEPQEEICDYLDNDCDGEIDELQTNVCGQCGPVPAEVCNGWDDDCDGETDEDLVQACSTACGTGVEVCSGGLWSGCTAQQPSQEICDGLDNDCNGQIDDGIECLCTIQDVGSLFPCAESPLLCGQGFKTCECLDPGCLDIVTTPCFAICHWLADPVGSDPLCDSLVGMALQEEECNNFDDNCNQLVDEDLFAGCYTGPEGTLGVGICEPGMMTCLNGTWGGYDDQQDFMPGMCMEEILPQDESCNGIDDDCDGEIDWGLEVPETDILFIVDWSGSMIDEIDAVLVALNQFAGYYSLEDKLRWGLVVGPRDAPNDYEERLYMISDISPFPDFLSSFAGLGDAGMNTGNEMLLDALYLSLQNISSNAPIDLSITPWEYSVGESVPPKDIFNISWRPGADRVVIVFSDEKPQSYLDPELSVQQIIDVGQATPQLKIYTFSTNKGWEWDELADSCNGSYYPLSDNSLEMYNYLMEILDEICMPPSE